MLKHHTKEEIEGKQRHRWLHVRGGGGQRFIWRSGLIGWGVPMFMLWMLLTLWLRHRLTWNEAVFSTVALPVWLLAGYWHAAREWRQMSDKFGA